MKPKLVHPKLKSGFRFTKDFCHQGQTAANTDCTPHPKGPGAESKPSSAGSSGGRSAPAAKPDARTQSSQQESSPSSSIEQLERKIRQAKQNHPKIKELTSPRFKAFFGDWESDPAHASKVVHPITGIPAETKAGNLEHKVDDEGDPIIVFHGTPYGEFEKFKAEMQANADSLYFGPGFYFTEEESVARVYSMGAEGSQAEGKTGKPNPYIIRAYLNIRKPFDVDKMTFKPNDLPENERKAVKANVVQQVLNQYGMADARDAAKEFDKGESTFTYNDLADTYGISKTTLNRILQSMGYDGITVLSMPKDRSLPNRHWIIFQSRQAKSVDNDGGWDPNRDEFKKNMDQFDKDLDALDKSMGVKTKGIGSAEGQPCEQGQTTASGCIAADGSGVNSSNQEPRPKSDWTPKTALAEFQGGIYNSKLGGYDVINSALRNGPGKYAGIEITQEQLDSVTDAIDENFTPSTKPLVLHRGLRNAPTLAKLKPGAEFTDKGYASTDLGSQKAKEFTEKLNRSDIPVLLQIHAPEGTPIVDVAKVTGSKVGLGSVKESEILLPRQTKFKVIKSSNKMGVVVLHVAVVSQD